MERKVPKYENHKLRERKVKIPTRNQRDHCRIGTRKHTETVSRYFDRHGRLYQSKEKNLKKKNHLYKFTHNPKPGHKFRNTFGQFNNLV